MAIFSSGMKIFKIAFQHVVDNSCMVPIAPFYATNVTSQSTGHEPRAQRQTLVFTPKVA